MLKIRNEQRKKLLSFFAILCIFVALSITKNTSVQTAQAAQKYVAEKAENGSIYVKNAKTGEIILSMENVNDIVSKGNKIYYIQNYYYDYDSNERQTPKLYQYDVKTKKYKILKKLTDPYEAFDVCELYSGNIYINGWNGSDNIACYYYAIKSGKLKKINKSSGYVERYKKYILMEPTDIYGAFGDFPISIYNTSTQKTKSLTKKSVGYSFKKGIVYYTDCITDTDPYQTGGQKVKIKSYSIKTGKTKTLVKNIKLTRTDKITNKYVYYQVITKNEDKYYRYTIKTGKKESLTMEKYGKLAYS